MNQPPDKDHLDTHNLTLQVMKHFDELFISLRVEIRSDMKEMFEAAFPEGDARAHLEYHKKVNASAKTWGEIVTDIRKKIVTGVVWGVIVTLTGIFTAWVAAKLGFDPKDFPNIKD